MKTIKILLAILFSIAVAACGGGGGGGSGGSGTPPPPAPTYKISGAVTGTSVQGVTITLSGGSTATIKTNALGAYSFDGLPAGTYTVTPTALAGYTYSPPSASLTISANTTQDFVSSPDLAYSISGTVSYVGAGPIGIRVYSTACLSCSSVGGTAIAAAGPYTVRGLQPGNYTVVAERYALPAVPNATNPFGKSSPVTIAAANLAGTDIAVADPATPTPGTPASLRVAPGNDSAFVMYSLPKIDFGQEYATSYRIYWGTDTAASTGGGSATFAAQGDRTNFTNFYVLSDPTLPKNVPLYFRMSSFVGAVESPSTAVFGPVTINAAAGPNTSTVSGTVTFPVAATGTMIVGLYSSTTGVYFTRNAITANPHIYSIAGVAAGSYFPFAVIDKPSTGYSNGNGVIDIGEISNVNATSGLITVASGVPATSNLTLSPASATASVNTDNYSSPGWNNYSLILGVNDGTRHAVAVTLESGPNVAWPFDMGANRVIPLGSTRPNKGDSYTFTVTYSDGISPLTETLSASVSDVLDTFATNMTATGGVTPTFTWDAPSSSPIPSTSYIYRLTLWGNADHIGWRYPQDFGLPSTTHNAVYNADGKAYGTSPTGANMTPGNLYNWAVQVRDANGNSASFQATYTP